MTAEIKETTKETNIAQENYMKYILNYFVLAILADTRETELYAESSRRGKGLVAILGHIQPKRTDLYIVKIPATRLKALKTPYTAPQMLLCVRVTETHIPPDLISTYRALLQSTWAPSETLLYRQNGGTQTTSYTRRPRCTPELESLLKHLLAPHEEEIYANLKRHN